MIETFKLAPVRPAWPKGIPCRWQDFAHVENGPTSRMSLRGRRDYLAAQEAVRLHAATHAIGATGITLGYRETFFTNKADHTAHANSTSEVSLLAGTNEQPVIPALHFGPNNPPFRSISILARGVISTTSTPTIIFQVRLGETAGSSFLSGTSIGVSPTITCASGVTTQLWELRLDLTCRVSGIGTGNATLSGCGYVISGGGFGTPFWYALAPTTPPTGTLTSTFNAAVTQYINLSATWGTASASNTITCKQLMVDAMGV